MNETERIMSIDIEIIEKVVQGRASEQEVLDCQAWRAQSSQNEQFFKRVESYYKEETASDELTNEEIEMQWNRFEQSQTDRRVLPLNHRRKLMIRLVSAAAIIAVSFLVTKFALNDFSSTPEETTDVAQQEVVRQEVKPQFINSDEITLATNEKVYQLDSVDALKNTNLKVAENALAYTATKESDVIEYHTLTIPKKKEFTITLSDGTIVHLNANTKLIYPSSFKGSKERRVQLDGEAFFEVAHNKEVKFIVETDGAEITVHGTKFNVNTYKPGMTETVLVEGSVSIGNDENQEMMLQPNQLANCSKGSDIVVKEVDVNNYISWRNGIYTFYKQSLYGILTEMASWYGYEVRFETEAIARSQFICNVPRYETIEEVMNVLIMSNSFKYNITDNLIIISPL